jgi:hypothetical protein
MPGSRRGKAPGLETWLDTLFYRMRRALKSRLGIPKTAGAHPGIHWIVRKPGAGIVNPLYIEWEGYA